jgi:hypothetical protein
LKACIEALISTKFGGPGPKKLDGSPNLAEIFRLCAANDDGSNYTEFVRRTWNCVIKYAEEKAEERARGDMKIDEM